MVRVKICGITSVEIALTAINAGADALGFVFAPSRRQITPDQARQIIKELPPLVTKVGVFVNESLELVNEIAHFCGLDVVQLHGQETPNYCRQMERTVIKGIAVRGSESLTVLGEYQVQGFLLDTYHPEQRGGTGQTFDWSLLTRAEIPRPMILAGGLRPDNVGNAVRILRPYGVDVSSGVETDGIKDPVKIVEFVRNAKGECIC